MKKERLIKTVELKGLSRIIYQNLRKKNKGWKLAEYIREKLIKEFGTKESQLTYLKEMIAKHQKQTDKLHKKMEDMAKQAKKLKVKIDGKN